MAEFIDCSYVSSNEKNIYFGPTLRVLDVHFFPWKEEQVRKVEFKF